MFKVHGMKREQDIFAKLSELCSLPGYIHAIAYFCFRDTVYNADKIVEENTWDFPPVKNRLIRTELTALIGLMIKKEIDYCIPTKKTLIEYVETTESLLQDIHNSLQFKSLEEISVTKDSSEGLFKKNIIRESSFYAAESAYPFQYLDFSSKKYKNDNDWLLRNKGFSIANAVDVVRTVGDIFDSRIASILASVKKAPHDKQSFLSMFTFTIQEVGQHSRLPIPLIGNVINAFALPAEERNQNFQAFDDFNVIHSQFPLIPIDNGKFIMFLIYSLTESLFDAPFYWMRKDEGYLETAMQNRGKFTEEFSGERLEAVFGKDNVHRNVNIIKNRKQREGEIDVLVIFGDRIIIVQAKSKKMTLEARRGSYKRVREDFQSSIQGSYNQGIQCANLLIDKSHKLVEKDSNGTTIREITIDDIKEVYIFCVVSDHYPSLAFQANNFLAYKKTNIIQLPFIMDVFTLDVMAEMLSSPLRFLSYVNRRVNYFDKLIANHETTILAYHLKFNLWIDNKYNAALVEDDIAEELHEAMGSRRAGFPGKKAPEGILTHFVDTYWWRLVESIEKNPNPAAINMGFFLLKISDSSIRKINIFVEKIAAQAKLDFKNKDFTFDSISHKSGITFHCNSAPVERSSRWLERHCAIRKYSRKAYTWFGICIFPDSALPRFMIELSYQWERDAGMDRMVAMLSYKNKRTSSNPQQIQKNKIGRNDPCPCGSGRKYKKCCLK